MARAQRRLSRRRIRIPARYWTAIPTKFFEEILPLMRRRHAAAVYLNLYHRAWHNKGKRIGASLKDLSAWTGLDSRTVRDCIRYLEWRRFIVCEIKGTLHSRDDLPLWRIPAAKFDMTCEGWVPVPSFLITHYLKAHPACLLLPLLLYYQNMHKKNECYPSVGTLSAMSGCWSTRMVYDSLKLLGNGNRWKLLGNDLPQPLSIVSRRLSHLNKWIRYYQVRAIYFHRERKRSLPVLFLTKDFSTSFGVQSESVPDEWE